MFDTFGIMDYRSFGGGDTASPDISYIMYTSRTCILYNMISIYVIISLLLYFTHGSAKHMQDHMAFRKKNIYITTRIIIICTTRR